MTSTDDLVLLEADGPVRTIRLNAPERRNALDLDLLAQLKTAIAMVAADEAAKALIVAGVGKSFCAGANLQSMFGDTSRPVHELRNHLYAGRNRELNANIRSSVRIAATSDLATSIDFESWAQASSVGSAEFQTFLQDFFTT